MLEDLAPSGYMRYAPDGHFVFASFASAFLLKLLRPEFANLLPSGQETEIFDLIGRLIQTLSSPEIAIDDRHTPKLYARFLAGLLSRYRRDGATVGRLHPQPPPTSQAQSPSEYNQSPSSAQSPGTFSLPQSHASTQGLGYAQGGAYTRPAERHDTPIYMPEATFTAGSGPIHFDLEMSVFDSNGVSEEEMLATMQALKNPAWWENMMMPGFSWPESPSPLSSVGTPPYHQPRGCQVYSQASGALLLPCSKYTYINFMVILRQCHCQPLWFMAWTYRTCPRLPLHNYLHYHEPWNCKPLSYIKALPKLYHYVETTY
ncbi:hypothetical protein BD779DRAFT_1001973 [Infundibulicybe gibba]|nr:hypothetical protein BD779DRAFT_1001973 [Infundibulicybe gibba]